MMRRVFTACAFSIALGLSACASVDDYPNEWHGADRSIHVYFAEPGDGVEIPANDEGEAVTLLGLVQFVDRADADLSCVVVHRRVDAQTLRLEVDVADMLRTGNTTANLRLRPGDVVRIAG